MTNFLFQSTPTKCASPGLTRGLACSIENRASIPVQGRDSEMIAANGLAAPLHSAIPE